MNKIVIQKRALLYFIIVGSLAMATKKSAQAQVLVGPKPLQYIESVSFYNAAGLSGEDDFLPERLPYEKTYTYEDDFHQLFHSVEQEGYVLTALAAFGSSPKKIPVLKIENTTTVTVASNGSTSLQVRFGDVGVYGAIYFYGEVINTSSSGGTRSVPVDMEGFIRVDISPSGKALNRVRIDRVVRELNWDGTYKPGTIFSDRIYFCEASKDYWQTCSYSSIDEVPGSLDFYHRWYMSVASGATRWFEVKLDAYMDPQVLASTSTGKLDMSSVYTNVQIDPFVYIDHEWEYANEYTLKLSPGMYVGPKFDLAEIITALQLLAGREISLGDLWLNDTNGDGRIGQAEIINMLQIVSRIR